MQHEPCAFCHSPSRLEQEGLLFVVHCDNCADTFELIGVDNYEDALSVWRTGRTKKELARLAKRRTKRTGESADACNSTSTT